MNSGTLRTWMRPVALMLVWMCLGVEGCLCWERGKIAVGNNESLRLNWRGSCRIRAKSYFFSNEKKHSFFQLWKGYSPGDNPRWDVGHPTVFSRVTISSFLGNNSCPGWISPLSCWFRFHSPHAPLLFFFFKHVPWGRSNLRGMKRKWLLHQSPCLSLGLGFFFPFPMFIFNLFLFVWLHWALAAACILWVAECEI